MLLLASASWALESVVRLTLHYLSSKGCCLSELPPLLLQAQSPTDFSCQFANERKISLLLSECRETGGAWKDTSSRPSAMKRGENEGVADDGVQ